MPSPLASPRHLPLPLPNLGPNLHRHPLSTPSTSTMNNSPPPQYLSWQMDSSTLPSSVSEMPSEPTQRFRSIHERLQTPGVPGPPPDITPPLNQAPQASVWDNETVSETVEEVEWRATINKVYEFLCALCVGWRTTACYITCAATTTTQHHLTK
uniref:Uncharacterized protein n=1 Tax=Moniliophthora roreri TaxID=221103 RepID=A0A0W0FQ88_MONRR